MRLSSLEGFAKGPQIITRLTEELTDYAIGNNPLFIETEDWFFDDNIQYMPYSIAFQLLEEATVSLQSPVNVAGSSSSPNRLLMTDIGTLTTTVTMRGKIFLSLDPLEVLRQGVVDAIDLRPPTSPVMPPFFQYETLLRWQATRQMLTFHNGRSYKNLIITNLTDITTPDTGVGAYGLSITLGKISPEYYEENERSNIAYDLTRDAQTPREIDLTKKREALGLDGKISGDVENLQVIKGNLQ